jgi:glycosyltransferase involved in cell wall biosynthesis/2-polyprenyl-3-methyl-5-hydroxy-6-metoxy-1,4-benzoquinol methylase
MDAPNIPRSRVRVLRVIARMNIGGPAYHVSLLSGRLDRERYETLLLTGALGRGEGSFEELAQRYGANRRVVPGLRPELNPLSDLRALVNLMRIIREFRPDVVHTHTAKAGTLGRLAAIITPGARPVIVHTYHGHVLTGYFGRALNAVFRFTERILAMKSDRLIGVSDATVKELVGLRVARACKFRTIPIGLDLERLLEVKQSDGDAFRVEVGAGPEDVLAVFVGRLVPIKRVDILIEAVALASAREPRLRVVIVGDGELRGALECRAARLGLDETVRFIGFREDLPSIAAGSDVAVLSSDNEGTPVALIEAAAAGLPAVATAAGGVADIVTGSTGILVAPGDVRAFADALLRLASDRDARERMGFAAREHVRERFAAHRLVSDIESLYQELLAERAAAELRARPLSKRQDAGMETHPQPKPLPMTPLPGCPSCGVPEAEPRGSRGDLRLVRCSACDLVYSNPQPIARVRERYLREYDLAAHFGEVEERKRVLFKRRLDSLGPPSADRARLCDVGCGDGLFLQMAAAVGWEPFGIEMNPPAADAAERRGAVVFRGAVEELDKLPFESFDLVCSWDVIEHTPTPRRFAERLSALVRPDSGRVVLSTLNTNSLVARTTGMRWRMIGDEHFTYWNEHSLTGLLETVGLDVVHVGYFGLGRDLVAPLDRLRPARRGTAPATGGAPGAGSSWDTRTAVLLAERTVNRFLDRTKLGVGIVVRSRHGPGKR